jgi:hypothetical protein
MTLKVPSYRTTGRWSALRHRLILSGRGRPISPPRRWGRFSTLFGYEPHFLHDLFAQQVELDLSGQIG